MKKRLLAITFAVVFAFIGLGSSIIIGSTYMAPTSVVEAALTTNQTRTVQTKLKRWGYYTGTVDGIYGNLTRKAVRYFQSKNGLSVDGIVGPQTARALGMSISSDDSSVSNNDLYLLAKCVYAEARGESYTGQVAVAAVILNRVESPDFPNTIAGVIYQPWAFTAVNDGQINLEPNQTAYNAARDALNGWDPSGGAIYYFNPSTATNKWIWSRPMTVTIGKHRFCK